MIDIPILIFFIFFLALIVGTKLKVSIISSYYSFIAFSLLYCFYMYVGSTIETGGLSLLNNLSLISYLIYSTFLGLFFFILFYWLFAFLGGNSLKLISMTKKERRLRIQLFLPVYILLFTILIVFAENYGWHAVSRYGAEGISTSLFAYAKYFFTCMGLIALWYKPSSKKWVVFILITQIILMLFDGGRTTFFGLVFAYTWILSRNGIRIKLIHAVYIFLFGFMLLATRAISLGGGLFDGMVSSIVAEGVFGGYNGLQIADYINGGGGFLYGLTYVLDPIIYLLPGGMRDDYLLFYTMSVDKYVGDEKFGPMGGFFWMAESIANFGFLGGPVVGSIFGYSLAKLELGKGERDYYRMAIIAALGALLSKVYFANGVKIAIFYIGSIFIIETFFMIGRSVCTRRSQAPSATPIY